jgi:hypothetical protein
MQLSDLLLKLSAKLIRVNSGDLDGEIKTALRIISDHVNYDWIIEYVRKQGRTYHQIHNFILETLEDVLWRIERPKGAVRRIGLKPSTLRQPVKNLNIQRPLPRN